MPPRAARKNVEPKTRPRRPNDINLQCSLCPKNPDFSDISHLLTHMASKGHLSHRFKLQLRAQGEQEAKDALESFDSWYKANQLDTLLADRMATKETKTRRKSRASGSSNVVDAKFKAVSRPSVKALEEDVADFRAPVPRMHLWPTGAEMTSDVQNTPYDQPLIYSTPTTRRHLPNFSRPVSPIGHLDPQLLVPRFRSFDGRLDTDGAISADDAQLKGVIWPGMDLFDSASPEQRRMRNQRKDESILQDMMTASKIVEPTEVSFTSEWDFRASRDVNDLPTSPELSPKPPASPKKPKVRKPAALAIKSSNIQRSRTTRKKKSATDYVPEKNSTSMHAHRQISMPSFPIANPLVGLGGHRRVRTTEYAEGYQSEMNECDAHKRDFAVFQDAAEVSPGRTESPLAEHHLNSEIVPSFDTDTLEYDDGIVHTHGIPSFDSTLGLGDLESSPTQTTRHRSLRTSDNKNLRYSDQPQQNFRRSLSASHVFPAQVFHDPMMNPLYKHHYQRSFTRSFSQSQQDFEQSTSHDELDHPTQSSLQYVAKMATMQQGRNEQYEPDLGSKFTYEPESTDC